MFLVFALILSSLIWDINKKVTNWISTGISSEKIKPLGTCLQTTMSNLGRVNLKFKNSVLVQNIFSSLCATFILSLYIVYELNTWLPNPANSFALKNCLFDRVKLTRNVNKSKLTYNSGRITLMEKVSGVLVMTLLEMLWYLVLIIVYHLMLIIEKNNFLGSGEGSTQGINDGTAEKKLVLTLVKQIQNFA